MPLSFNGATAMKPWKSITETRGMAEARTLQWGHGDEAVEEQRAGPSYHAAVPLQWGHGDEAVEEGPPPGPFGAEDLGPGLREGRPAGVSNRSRARAMKS